MQKVYRDRDWLYEHYVVQGESISAIAHKTNCNSCTINKWLRKLGIPVRNRGARESVSLGFVWLYEHYVNRKESMPAMAKAAHCAYGTINRQLHKAGIAIRGRGEGHFLVTKNFLVVSPELLGLLEGELLGDGCVVMNGAYSAQYSHGSQYQEYLIWLSGQFANLGLAQAGKIRGYRDKRYNSITYNYISKSYPELADIRKRWYPSGKKIVPKDLKLTPLICRQWYLGDGHLHCYKRGRPYIVLATCGFDYLSIKYLLKELNRLGFKATHRPSNNTIGLSVYSIKDFLEWIGPSPISCYDYKWDYSRK